MPEPQSPFDEPAEEPEQKAESEEKKLPDRKWSFVILAVSMFLLVWIREITGLTHGVTLYLAFFVFVGWLIIHFVHFVDTSQFSGHLTREFARSGSELAEPTEVRILSSWTVWFALFFGMLLGMWLPYIIFYWTPFRMILSPLNLTVVVCVLAIIVRLATMLAVRR